ncbi:hypothetical protein HID58_056681 [Brassica napus]|uniref:Uncharacterized protein n=1 Tax=Brassica napus TaxID=3708 RepID=A0ABQ8ANZ3_BRANA|nr:hypothetical protein HID58_056681 [Brassica napus]
MSSNLFDDEEDRSSGGCGGYGGEGGYEDGKREGRYKRLVDTMVVDVWLFERWRLWWYSGGGCGYMSGGYGVNGYIGGSVYRG